MSSKNWFAASLVLFVAACSPGVKDRGAAELVDEVGPKSTNPAAVGSVLSTSIPELDLGAAEDAWRELTALIDSDNDYQKLDLPFRSGDGIYSAMTLKLFLGDEYEGEYGTEVLVLSWDGVSWEPMRQIPCFGNPVHYGLSLRMLTIRINDLPVFTIDQCGLGVGIAKDAIEWDEESVDVALQVVDGAVREVFSGSAEEDSWIGGVVFEEDSILTVTNCVASEDAYYTDSATGEPVFAGMVCTRREGEALTVQPDGSIDRSSIGYEV